MRICKIKDKQYELTTAEWLQKGCPEVIGSTNLQSQEPYKQIDWSKGVLDVKIRLSKDEFLMKDLAQYICFYSKDNKHQFSNYSYHFKLVDYLLDWAFDCNWFGELTELQENVTESEHEDIVEKEEELDAMTEDELDLNKLKFSENDTSTITEKDRRIRPAEREEEGVELSSVNREGSGSNKVLSAKTPSSKKGRAKKRS